MFRTTLLGQGDGRPRLLGLRHECLGPATRGARGALVLLALAVCASHSPAQELEPRSYSNAPVGLNFLVAGYSFTEGGVSFDPAVPIEDAKLHTNSAVLAYARTLDAWGNSAKFDVVVPYTWLDGSAKVAGEPKRRVVDGFADPRFRFQVNFFGAPALPLKEYAAYRQDVVIGGSLQVFVPLGQYDNSRLVNIGTNRWAFKPEIGISKAWDSWIFEFAQSVTFYTDNKDFYPEDRTLEVSPLYAAQAHVVYAFRSGLWAALDGTWYRGARTTVDGVKGDTLQSVRRVGATLAVPVNRNNSVKLYGSVDTYSRTGSKNDSIGVLWQYRWGGGF